MSFAYSRLAETTIPATVGQIYTNPASTTTYIRTITFHNGNTTSELVAIYRVADNATAVGTAAVTNRLFYDYIEPGGTKMITVDPPGFIMEDENDTIQAVTTTASKVGIWIDGATE